MPYHADEASDSVAEVVERLKRGTSREIRKEYPEPEEFLWWDSFWKDGCVSCRAIGTADEEVVRRKIRKQRRNYAGSFQHA